MRPLRTCVALMVLVTTLLFTARPAAACSCAGPPFEADADAGILGIEAYEAVFIGTAVDRRPVGEEAIWTFDVEAVVAGEVSTPIELQAPAEGGACGLDIVSVGEQWAVGVYTRQGRSGTDLCSIDRPEALDGIGDRREPAVAQAPVGDDGLSADGGWGLGLIGIGFAAVLGAVAVAVVLGRRPASDNTVR